MRLVWQDLLTAQRTLKFDFSGVLREQSSVPRVHAILYHIISRQSVEHNGIV